MRNTISVSAITIACFATGLYQPVFALQAESRCVGVRGCNCTSEIIVGPCTPIEIAGGCQNIRLGCPT
ncbi:hypothetical protein SISSUDRAFT_1045063 [Sistotremastrum suecicum HHB10207 ss-3]|uniref:Hydrophobin n=1 Tax=Sistotremastrum suecicum HHB10207 ss-3 TaxID=1314776 RepID=A0A166EMV0_9AGAM|nr:hypothetical protein SISSUDRAFT_1045063 [Sistotremastrum suecicum HHB10207 ss-3]